MQKLLPEGDWKMSAVIGMNDIELEQICKNIKIGFVVPVNYNCKGQIVVSGEKEAVEELSEKAKEKGAKKVRILKTEGPFHTIKLQKASEELRKELNKVKINQLQKDVIKNIDGNKYEKNDDVKEILANHIINPVKFSKTLENMINEGVDTFIEIGPGKTLSGFVKRTPTNK